MTGARDVALSVLADYRRSGKWSDAKLHRLISGARLGAKDSALTVRLCYGVLQNLTLLDFYISSFSSVPGSKIEPRVRDILRLGLYQIALLDKIPASAAVNESVALAKRHTPRALGYINAVLRKAASSPLPEPSETDPLLYLSIVHSFPLRLVTRFAELLGHDGAQRLLTRLNSIPPIYAQVNTFRTTRDELEAKLKQEGVECSRHEWLSDCLVLDPHGAIGELSAFKSGLFYIQDPASRLSVMAAGIKPGQTVLDGCAAPGGKSFAAALAMNGIGSVLSFDIQAAGVEKIREGATRLGLQNISASERDSRSLPPDLSADVVLADVPCSGLGVISKKPDIKYKPAGDFPALAELQLSLIRALSARVRPEGVLLYSTCTLLPEENENILEQFLSESGDFHFESFTLPCPGGEASNGHITLWPHITGTDGFFIAKLKRKAE